MKNLLITALALGSLGAVACQSDNADATDGASAQIEAPNAKTVSFSITGMT